MTIERASGAGAEPGPLPPFETPLAILPGDVDELGHVNNVVYLRWIQELAIAHWNSGTTTDERAALVWVVARHEVDYERPVLPGDAVIGRAWIGAQVGRDFERSDRARRRPALREVAHAVVSDRSRHGADVPRARFDPRALLDRRRARRGASGGGARRLKNPLQGGEGVRNEVCPQDTPQ